MTNKERLDNLTEKVNELTETLNNKILALDGSDIEIDIPDQFSSARGFYYFKLDNNTVMISPQLSDGGIWLYYISTKTWEQIFEGAGYWSTWQSIGDDYLISGAGSPALGILLYEPSLKTITKLSDVGYARQYHVLGDKCLIYSTSTAPNNYGLVLYNANTKTLSTLYVDSYNWSYIAKVNTDYILSTGSAANGLLKYDYNTDEITKIYDNGYFSNNYTFKDKIFLSTRSNNYTGILVYDFATKDVTKKYELGYGWSDFEPVGENECLINTDYVNSSTFGLLLYSYETNEIRQIYSGYTMWDNRFKINNKILLGNRAGSNTGILLYDITNKTLSQLFTEGWRWDVFQQIGDLVLISSTNNFGVLLFDSVTNAIEKIYTTSMQYIYKFSEQKYLMSGTQSSTGIKLFKVEDRTIYNLSNKDSKFVNFYRIGDKCLISSSNYSGGLYVYDDTTETATRLYVDGGNYNIISEKDTKVILSSDDKSSCPYTLEYNSIDDSVKVVKYYLEGVK